jgi:hypothetical protein
MRQYTTTIAPTMLQVDMFAQKSVNILSKYLQ